ncbi:MAG: hypothetical protein ABS79_01700 [Planctomycetes bacterium SCN 63-9]|nr:MAG: hypothetical protein ABS79_01700 [Planctomycetes bacterium SCN 63-9]
MKQFGPSWVHGFHTRVILQHKEIVMFRRILENPRSRGMDSTGRGRRIRDAASRRAKALAFRVESLEDRVCLSAMAFDDTATVRQDLPTTVDVLANDSSSSGTLDPMSLAIVTGPSHGSAAIQTTHTVLHTNDDGSPVGNGFASALGDSANSFGAINLGVSGYSDFGFVGAHSQSGDYSLFVRLGVSDFSSFDPTLYDYRFDDSVSAGAIDTFEINGLAPGTPYIAWIDNTVGAGRADTVLGVLDTHQVAVYTPNPGYLGTDSFAYTVADQDGVSNMATVSVTVVPNLPPVAGDDAITVVGDRSTNINNQIFSNDFDPDGFINQANFTVVTAPANGTVAVDSFGQVVYTPAPGFNGTDSFAYTITDSSGAVSNAATVSVTVVPNQPPVAGDDTLTADAGTGIVLTNLLANDFDPNGDPLSNINVVSGPSHGTIAFNSTVGALVYTPAPGYTGADSFTYTVTDSSNAASNVATVNVNVLGIRTTVTSPTAGGVLPSGVTPVGGIVLDLIGINGVRVVSQLAASSLYVGYFNGGTPVSYQGNPGTIGIQTSFSPEALAALGGGLAEAAIRVTLFDGDTGVGDFDDQGQNFLVINGVQVGDFSDIPTVQTTGDGLILISRNPDGGFRNEILDTGFFYVNDPTLLESLYASLTAGSVTYQVQDVDPYDNYFDFTQGVDGELSDIGTLPNLRPVARDDATTTPLNTPIAIDILSNDTDTDGSINATTVVITSGPAHGAVAVDPTTGMVTYTPNSSFSGTDTFRYTVRDDDGAVSAEATVSVNILPLPSITDVRIGYGTRSYSLLSNTRTLPFVNINSIQISFGSDVNLTANDLQLLGINVPSYGISAFNYDPSTHTATWTLANSIGADRLTLKLLGGEVLRFNVLPGDYNQDGTVTIADSLAIRNAIALADLYADLDGDGDIDLDDINAPRNRRLGTTLP